MNKIFRAVGFVLLYALILEAAARLIYSVPQMTNRIVTQYKSDIAWIRMWEQRGAQGFDLYYTFDRYDASRGWAVAANVANLSVFEDKRLNTNSKGIRGSREYSYEKPQHAKRIVVLGDSFTFGDEASDGETFPHHLQQRLPETEIINMGVHGYGHDQMLIYLKEEGMKYLPDIVILGYVEEDADRNMLAFRDYAKPRFKLTRSGGLALYDSPVPSPEKMRIRMWWTPRLVLLGRMILDQFRIKTGIYDVEKIKITEALLRDIARTSKEGGARPIFAYIGNVRDQTNSGPGLTDEEMRLQGLCESIQVECVFLRETVQGEVRKGLEIKNFGHYDSKTNELIASGISEYLRSMGFV